MKINSVRSKLLPIFPTDLGCFIESGNSNTLARNKEFLAGKYASAKKDSFKATFMCFGDEEAYLFKEWWVNELLYGQNPFEIDLTFFGLNETKVGAIQNNLQVKKAGSVWLYPLVIEFV